MSRQSPEPAGPDRRVFLKGVGAGAVLAAIPACASYRPGRPAMRWASVETLIRAYLAEGKYPGAIAALS